VLAQGRLVYQGAMSELLATASPSLRVIVRPPAGNVLAALAAAPWVRSVAEGDPGQLTIDVADPDAAELHLPEILAEHGARLVEVGPAGLSLQDVFFQLTATGPAHYQEASR
jgi:hypothetical protein